MRSFLLPLIAAVAFVLATGVGSTSFAQTATQIVETIEIRGNQRIEPSTIESYLRVRPGDPFDDDQLDESLKSLYATGLFDDVAITQDGSTLVVSVVENPIINRIAFEGNLRLDDETLDAEVQLRPRVVYTRARVQTAVNRILELYRRNGRFAATVEPKVIQLEQNRVDLVFEINEGPLTGVAGITFIGNEAFSDGTLRSVIATKESAFWRILSSSDTYDPDRLAFDQELLRRYYRARGYADFAVISAIAELTPDGSQFFITFTLEEGDRFDFGEIGINAQLRDLSVEDLEAFLTTESRDTYNADQIESTIQALTDEVGQLGYAFGRVEADERTDRENLVVDVTYVIDEGPRVYVEQIDIHGNIRTLDRVIRREFRIAEGDAFNAALIRRSRQRLQNLDFFETVNIQTIPGSAPDKVIVDVEVAEKSTGELSFGAGFSTTDGPLGDIRLTERNLLGRGQSISANFTVSGRRQEIELSFTEPYFLGYDFAAGVDLFRSRTDFQSESNFDEQSTGFRLRGSYPLTERLRHSVRYTLREDEIDNVDNNASVFIQDEEGSSVTSAVGQTFTYDRRDTRFLPSEGYYLQLDQDLAGLGGDNRFIRHEGRADYYYPFFPEVVLNIGASAGYITGYGGEDVDLSNRFFIGGSSFRGFQFGGIGPRDTETDDSLGGNLYYVGTAELRFPLGLPEELRIFGRTFAEAGTLTEIDVSGPTLEDSSNLRVAGGVGLSWFSPLGPLSLDFAQAFVKESGDETEVFRVSFGTRF